MPVTTGRATIIDVGVPLTSLDEARAWLRQAGDADLEASLAVLNRALHAYRLAIADPYVQPISAGQALIARIGFGAGEQVADGLWMEANELPHTSAPRGRRRAKILQPQARVASVLTARETALACEELTLRARFDLDQGHEREAALQLQIALDAALAELAAEPAAAPSLAERLSELGDQRGPVSAAARAALTGPLTAEEREAVSFALGRLEAALRARAVANA
jgi:hypothetical protein